VGTLNLWTLTLAGSLILSLALLALWMRRLTTTTTGTWDCGYTRPTARMQYTASSFAASILELFRWILRPHTHKVRLTALFPTTAKFASHVGDIVLDGWLSPAWSTTKKLMLHRRSLQQGSLQRYLALIWLTLMCLLGSLMPWQDLWAWLLASG
jgi:hydrogenase-4 component B